MIPTFHDFPDAELVAVKWLTGAGLRVSTALPAAPVWPCLTVTRIGGATNALRAYDRARLQIDGWGADKASARLITSQALTALWAMTGTTVADVTSVDPDLGLAWLPDDTVTPTRPRYIAGVVVTLR